MTARKPTIKDRQSSTAPAVAVAGGVRIWSVAEVAGYYGVKKQVVLDWIRIWSVAEVAGYYGVKKQVVLDWIHVGLLRAIDVRAPGSKRPRFKILPADLSAFEAARASRGIAEKVETPARRKQTGGTSLPIGRRW